MEIWFIVAGLVALAVVGLVAKSLLTKSSGISSPTTPILSRTLPTVAQPSAPATISAAEPATTASSTTSSSVTDLPKGKDSASASNGELWNRGMLSEITNNDSAMELEMIETFIESTADEWRKFETALAANVSKDAEIYAHSIKGAAKYTGAKKVADVAFEVEKICKAGDLEGARRKKGELLSAIDETCAVLKDFLEKNK